MDTKAICRQCGNALFDCGLDYEPLWCGACGTRVKREDAKRVCPRCGKTTAKGILWLDEDLGCPA